MSPSREAQVLRLVADVCGLLEINEFRHGLLDALNRALPSKYVSLNEIGPTPDTVAVIVRPDLAPETTSASRNTRGRTRSSSTTNDRATDVPTASPT